MKDEIKEILDNLIRYRYSDYECKQPEDCLTIEDVWLLLDYITNLQTIEQQYSALLSENAELENRITNLQDKIKQYEDPEDLTLFHMWLDEKAKDKIKQLQEENKNLKQINEEHRKINGELRNGYCEIKEKCNKGECDCTNEEYESMAQANMKLRLLLDDYKTRIDKAIELILEKITYDDEYPGYMQMLEVDYNNLLEILQGSDE